MKTVYFDTDNTIVYAASEFPELSHLPKVSIGTRDFYVNTNITEKIKDFYGRGHKVIVWSAGGEDWAEQVVIHAGLINYVYETFTKPDWVFDDKDTESWMPEAEHVEPPNSEHKLISKDNAEDVFKRAMMIGAVGSNGTDMKKLMADLWNLIG